MRTVPAALAAAIEAPERTTRIRLSVDWDGDGHGPAGSLDDLSGKAASVQVESVLQTTLPDEVAVVEGTAAATLSADLTAGDSDDERLAAVQYFSPTQSASPLHGKQRLGRDVECDVEFLTDAGWMGAPLLRGISRAMPASVAQRRARLDALDRRHRLRTKVQLPVLVADSPPYEGFLATPIKPGLEGTWVVSFVLWKCGLALSPPPRTGCRLWIPLHGSAVPFLGKTYDGSPTAYDDFDNPGAMRFGPGPFVLGTADTVATGHHIIAPFATGPQLFATNGRCTGRVEMWVFGDSGTNSAFYFSEKNNLAAVTFTVYSNGALQITLWNGTIDTYNGPSVPRDGQWHYVGVHIDDPAGRAVFRIDGTSTVVTFTPTGTQTGIIDEVQCQLDFGGRLAELQVTAGIAESEPWRDLTYTAPAVVDRSQLSLSGIAPSDPAEGWQILQELAAAEQGASYFDPAGIYHYATRARLVTAQAQSPQRTVEADQHILDLAYNHALDQVRNVVTCPYEPLTITMRGEVWQLAETVEIGPGAQHTFLVNTSLATSVGAVAGQANSKSNGTGTQYFIDLAQVEVTAVLTRISPTAVQVVVTNHLPITVWLVDTTGAPKLTITGDTVAQGTGASPPVFTNAASVARYGEQPLDLPSSRWVQTYGVAAGLAMVTGLDLGEPRPLIADLSIPGDPRLEPFDRLTVRDPDNTGLDLDVWHVGARHAIDADGGFVSSLTCRPARNQYLAGVGLEGEDLVG